MKNYLLGSSYYGKIILIIGLVIAVPLIVLPFYPEEKQYALSFLIPSIFSIILGIVVCFLAPRKEPSFKEWQSPMQKGSPTVLFAWCYGIAIGAVPFIISGQLHFTHALFESVSGWSTTGLAIIDVAVTPHIFLFHRSFMQYCGGLGFIMFLVMVFSGKQAVNLYNAEGHPDKLMPNLKRTVQTIFLIYNGFLVLGSLLYCILGMNLFEAICHTMSALATAGSTTRTGSIGEYDSIPIELITIILMLIGSTNFMVLLLFVKRKFREILRISEVRFMIALVLVLVPLTALSLIREMGLGVGRGLHNALFGVVAIFSTTGYSTMNYAQWPPFALGLLLVLMIIGGGIGSTAGGIKLSRAYLLLRITRESIRQRLSPAREVKTLYYYRAQGKTPIDNALITDTVGFIACYIGILIIGTLLITLTANCSLFDAMFAFTSAFSTTGLPNGMINANTGTGTLIVEMVGMILGRLEIFIVFIGLYSCIQVLKQRIQKKYKNGFGME